MIVETSQYHPVMAALLAPLYRLQEASWGERLLGLAAGFWSFLTTDSFVLLMFLLVMSGTFDTIYGRRVAIALDRYDQSKAELGLQSKIMGLAMAALIRGFEAWWAAAIVGGRLEGLHTHGYLAMAVAATLFVHDLKSIQEKRVRFGQPPLPIITQVLDVLDGLAAMLGAGPPKDAQLRARRTGDPEGSTYVHQRSNPHEVHESIEEPDG